MTKVTPDMVKKLRDLTGVGMGKCKEALDLANGDIELAISNLRKAGIASAVKKEGRSTNEGIISVGETEDALALLEVNSETDFVAKNDIFQQFVATLSLEIARTKPASVEAFLAQKAPKDPQLTIDQYRAVVMQSLGENIQISRLTIFSKGPGVSLASYSHMGGKLVTLVELTGTSGAEALAREIAMHVAAEAPQYVDVQEVPESVRASEEEIAREQVKGKPENVMAKIVEGKLNAFYDMVCLNRQKFVKDPSKTIASLVAVRSKELGKSLVLTRFVRWQVGSR